MASFSWKTGVSGDWMAPANWTPATVPNDAAADVLIDAPPAGATAYTVTIAGNESIVVNTLTLNATNNAGNAALGAVLEVDGTLTFAPGSAGEIGGPLQSILGMFDGTIVNAGTINAFVQGGGISTFTGTNAIYITNWLQSVGTVTVDQSIAEFTAGGTTNAGGTFGPSTLFDGIFEAQGANSILNLGGKDAGQIVNIATISGPGVPVPGTDIPGWTQLLFDDQGSAINEWNGTGYVAVESTITTIQNNATIDVGGVFGGVTHIRDYTTSKAFTIGNNAAFNQVGGTLATGGLTILNGGTLFGAPTVTSTLANDGTVVVSGGTLVVQGAVTGAGVMTFDKGSNTLELGSVAAGQTVTMDGDDTLILDGPQTFKGTLAGAGKNTVLLKGQTADSAVVSGNTLQIMNQGTVLETIGLSGGFTSDSFGVVQVGSDSKVSVGVAVPVVTAGATANYAPGGPVVPLDAVLTVSDNDSPTLTGGTVRISAGFAAGDNLAITTPAGITSSYNSTTGVLTLTGSAPLADYQTALDSVTYGSTSADPGAGGTDLSRTITWSVSDGTGTGSATSTVSFGVTPPVVTAGATASYAPGGPAVTADPALSVSDVDSTALVGATVSISTGFVAGDTLAVSAPAGITSSYNAATGVLTLSGAASLAAYKAALELVTYSSSSVDPSVGGTDLSRTITWSASDGTGTGSATSTVSFGVTPPVVTAGGTASYTPSGPAVTADAALAISDVDSTTLVGATVSVSTGFVAGDTLAVSSPAGITSSYNAATGVLTLSGAASLAAYQAALDLVTYSSSTADPSVGGTDLSRTITWSVSDGTGTGTATSTVSIPAQGGGSGGGSGEGSGGGSFGILSNTMTSDVFQQSDDGTLAIWQMNGVSVTASGQVGLNPGPDWQIHGVGNFFGNGDTGILWQNSDGSVAIWDMKGATIAGGDVIGLNPGPDWQAKGVGNFFGSGNSDILWQNSDGSAAIWHMNGTTIAGGNVIGFNPGSDWQIKGTGDFFHDGRSDILWQNVDGSVGIWDMQGTTIIGGGVVGFNPGADWHVKGVGNFFGGGNTDIAWQNDSGAVAIWHMNGTTIAGGDVIGFNPGPEWHLRGTGSLSDDSNHDLLFQNDDGSLAIWKMQGATIAGGGVISANLGSSWHAYSSDGMRFINGENGNDTMMASSQPDQFVLASFAAGEHTIAGFDVGHDIVELSKSLFPTFDDVQAHTTASGGGAFIDLGNSSSLLLQGVSPDNLRASNFALV